MHLSKLVHSQTGKYVMSVLLGLGLATLFRTVCKDKNCIIYQLLHGTKLTDKLTSMMANVTSINQRPHNATKINRLLNLHRMGG